MKTSKLNMFGDMNSIPENGRKVKSFDEAKRDFETAYASGGDYSTELMSLATAIAYSVVNKCIDPQRKAASTRETVSKRGLNPAMLNLKRDISHDTELLESTRRNAEKSTKTEYNEDGESHSVIADKDAYTAVSALIEECLGDGIDLVQEAALTLIEQAAEHATAPKWLDTPYTVRRLSKRVYIKTTDSAAYRDEEVTPMQEVYRAVRGAVQNSRAVQTDPRNGYVYIDAMTPDGLETMFYRCGKWYDLGGVDSMGNYTTDETALQTYESIIEKLNLTDRQATIIHLRMQGYGYTAIATYLGVTENAIGMQVRRLRDRAAAIGFAPDGYIPKPKEPKTTTRPASCISAVVQMDMDGNEVARFATLKDAREATGACQKSMYNAIRGYQKTAGGYRWRVEYSEE